MLNAIQEYYDRLEEPYKGSILAIRHIILNVDDRIEETWKYGGPFFCLRGRMFAYFWMDKKTKTPYIGFVYGNFMDHPKLEAGDRKRIKVFKYDPNKDLPAKDIKELVKRSVEICDQVVSKKLKVYSNKVDVKSQLK